MVLISLMKVVTMVTKGSVCAPCLGISCSEGLAGACWSC